MWTDPNLEHDEPRPMKGLGATGWVALFAIAIVVMTLVARF